MKDSDAARKRVAHAGDIWRLRLVAHAATPTKKTKRELSVAVEILDAAIGDLFDAVHLEQTRKDKP
jgi:hypothetical protein